MLNKVFESLFLPRFKISKPISNKICAFKCRSTKSVTLILIFLFLTLAHALPQRDDNEDYSESQDDLVDDSIDKNTISNVYDPRVRDFTSRCMQLAQYSGTFKNKQRKLK